MVRHKNLIGEDLHISRSNTGSGTPSGSITPGIIGEFYFDTTNTVFYIATGLTNSDWSEIQLTSTLTKAQFTGANCSGTEPNTGRILGAGVVPVMVVVEKEVLYEDTDYTLSGNDVTFLIPIIDVMKIEVYR